MKRAVVFVHGFSGSAMGTWADFYSLVDDRDSASDWWQDADLFFYEYFWESMFRRIGRNASGLYTFLDKLFPAPDPALFADAEMSDRPGFKYEELFLVGHSEGGVLLRHVMLTAASLDQKVQEYEFEQTPPEPAATKLLKGQLRLFAPAIAGESMTGLLGLLARTPVIERGLSTIAAKSGLQPSAGPVSMARAYTDHYSKVFRMRCFRAHILWSDDDKIVDEVKYLRDIECPERPPGTSHTSVCKPKRAYPLPLTFVEKGTNGGCK